jgi:hypothetical protein
MNIRSHCTVLYCNLIFEYQAITTTIITTHLDITHNSIIHLYHYYSHTSVTHLCHSTALSTTSAMLESHDQQQHLFNYTSTDTDTYTDIHMSSVNESNNNSSSTNHQLYTSYSSHCGMLCYAMLSGADVVVTVIPVCISKTTISILYSVCLYSVISSCFERYSISTNNIRYYYITLYYLLYCMNSLYRQ